MKKILSNSKIKYRKINNCTLLIITHERPILLKNSIDYYNNFFSYINVLDSSSKINTNTKVNGNYYHCKKKNLLQKILFGLSKVKTDYVIISSDDDFYLPDSIKSGISFLSRNNEFASVSGKYFSFEKFKSINKYNLMYKKKYFDLDEENAMERIKKICISTTSQLTYNLFRKKILYKSLIKFKFFNQANFLEIAITLCVMLFGKHKFLKKNWMIRDGSVNTIYYGSTSLNSLFSLKNINSKSIEKKFFIKYFLLLNQEKIKFNKKSVQIFIRQYFNNFNRNLCYNNEISSKKIIFTKLLKNIYKFIFYRIFYLRYYIFFSKKERVFINLFFKK
jgi:glycosyltransferase domain-containing protein